MINLTDSDNGKTVKAKKDDEVVITLAWKPSSGFVWQQADTTAAVLSRIKHEGDNPTPGGTVHVSFFFKIIGVGSIVLLHARPWDEQNPPNKWFTVNVQLP